MRTTSRDDVARERIIRALKQCTEEGAHEISLLEFVELTGLPEQQLKPALDSLVCRRILEERDGGQSFFIVN